MTKPVFPSSVPLISESVRGTPPLGPLKIHFFRHSRVSARSAISKDLSALFSADKDPGHRCLHAQTPHAQRSSTNPRTTLPVFARANTDEPTSPLAAASCNTIIHRSVCTCKHPTPHWTASSNTTTPDQAPSVCTCKLIGATRPSGPIASTPKRQPNSLASARINVRLPEGFLLSARPQPARVFARANTGWPWATLRRRSKITSVITLLTTPNPALVAGFGASEGVENKE